MGLIQPLNIIALHIVDKKLVQGFSAKENDNDFSFSSTCEQEASCTAPITLFYLRFPVLSQGLHPNNEMVIKCWHSQPRCFHHIYLKCEHDAYSLPLVAVDAVFLKDVLR